MPGLPLTEGQDLSQVIRESLDKLRNLTANG
jgi:hypothetical protein